MIGVLINIVLISLFCNGIYLLFNFGNVFDFIRLWYLSLCGGIQRNDGRITYTIDANDRVYHPIKIFFYKPLFGCITCMASIWGSVGYLILSQVITQHIIIYPITIVCCACMNLLINRIYE